MRDNHALQLLLSSLLVSIGFSIVSAADSGDETDLVVPFALSPDEIHLLREGAGRSRRHRYRGHRSLPDADSQDSKFGEHEENLFLRLPAFGRELYLYLKRDAGFLSEGFKIEEKEDKKTRLAHIPQNQLCFYTGRVLNYSNSFASLSTCSGLTGLIQIGEERMLIEPVNGTQNSFIGMEHNVIRQKRSLRSSSRSSKTHPEYCTTIPGKKKLKQTKPTEDGRSKRNAIRLHSEYVVETVVVADSDMVQYHGAEAAQRFILTVMNMVYNMFHHKSLGIRLNIRVTKLVLLHSRPEKLKIGHHGERSLESFCHWQQEEYGGARYLGNNQIPGGKDDVPPVDVAVFVTRCFCSQFFTMSLLSR